MEEREQNRFPRPFLVHGTGFLDRKDLKCPCFASGNRSKVAESKISDSLGSEKSILVNDNSQINSLLTCNFLSVINLLGKFYFIKVSHMINNFSPNTSLLMLPFLYNHPSSCLHPSSLALFYSFLVFLISF